MTTNRRSVQLLVGTVTALTEGIARHMPASPYRDFTIWACSPKNPRQREFLQATGTLQLINMTTTLLSGLVDDDRWPTMLRYISLMNAYQVLEVISDDLAIGLGNADLSDSDRLRRGLISTFNRAMVETLTPGRRQPAVLLLAGPARAAAKQTSGFEHSKTPEKRADMAAEFALSVAAQGKPVPSPEEIEFGLWPALVANVETCRELVDVMEGTATASLLRQGLIDRYRAVDRTLFAEHLSRLELASLGAQTILIAPTLAFVLGALLEKVHPVDGYPKIIANGWINDVLSDAALLIRLQNDVGSRLLRMAPVQQAAVLNKVAGDGEGGLERLLDQGNDPIFTRLHKDMFNGESNLALWHARRASGHREIWQALAESLAYYAGLYAQHSARLATGLAALDERLGDRRAGTVIERLVRFHERMYSYAHSEVTGEYAV